MPIGIRQVRTRTPSSGSWLITNNASSGDTAPVLVDVQGLDSTCKNVCRQQRAMFQGFDGQTSSSTATTYGTTATLGLEQIEDRLNGTGIHGHNLSRKKENNSAISARQLTAAVELRNGQKSVSVVARPARVRRAPATKPTAQELGHSRRRPAGWIDASAVPTHSSRRRPRCRRR